MSRTVSIDCTPNEIRIAVGTKGLTGVSLEHVVCCPLALDENEELISSPKTLEAIQSLLKRVGVRSGDAVVCVGRSSIELRALTLPTVDRNELPDMVRFAAQRHFANVGDNWPIDFVSMPSSQDNMTECLAASMNPALIERVHKVLETCGLTLTQLVLRPMAFATMAVIKQPQMASSIVLLLDLFRDEADMAVTENGHVVFMRNVRFSGSNDAASNQQVLTGEIKRTMIAAASQRPNLNVEQIRIWGDEAHHAELCRSLSKSLSVPVTSLDPFQLFDASQAVRDESGGDSGKFAASLGALLAPQVADRLIDFSNPRKRVEKTKPVVMYAVAGGIAATLLISGVAWYFVSHMWMDSSIAELNQAIKKNEATIVTSKKAIADWSKVEKFLKADHPWLDELEYLSTRMADSDKAIFSRTIFTTDPTGSSSVSTKFLARKQEDVPVILDAFRDPKHEVKSTGITPSQDKTNQFPWMADLVIKMPAATVSDPRSAIPKMSADPIAKSKVQKTQESEPSPAIEQSKPVLDQEKTVEPSGEEPARVTIPEPTISSVDSSGAGE